MVLTLSIPAAGGFFGPGYRFHLQTSVFGPFLPTTIWQVTVTTPPSAGGRPLGLQQSSTPPTSLYASHWYFPDVQTDNLNELTDGAAFGADIEITGLFVETASQVFIDGPTTFTGRFWDPYGAIVFTLDKLRRSTGDGFSPQDSTKLSEVHRAVSLTEYQTTAVHLNLSGSGTINLATATRAIQWSVTTFPPGVTVPGAAAPYFFDLGFITPKMGNVFLKSTRVSFNPQLLVLTETTHAVAFDLAPGLVLEIVELSAPLA